MSETLNWKAMHKDATTVLEGEFPLVIVEAVAAKSSNDKDMIKWKAKVEAGPYAGRPLWGNFTISPESPGAMRILFSHLAVLGIDEKFFEKYPEAPVALIAQAIIGRKAIGVIGVRQWNGQDREEVQQWKPALGAGNASLGVLGGFGGGPASLPAGLGGSPSTPATPLATGGVITSTAGRQVPPMRHDSVPVEGAPATEPTVAESVTTPPEMPF